MIIKTRYFGDLEITDDQLITFSEGIPGFESIKRFILLTDPSSGDTFRWLQSATEDNVAFVLLDVFRVIPDYAPEVSDDDMESLEITENTARLLLNVVVIPDNINDMTVNLRAPILLNLDARLGKQIMLEAPQYDVRHNVKQEVENYKRRKAGE